MYSSIDAVLKPAHDAPMRRMVMRFITRRMDARISLTSPAISAVMRLRCGCEADDNGASCSEALTPGAQPVTLLWGAESGSAAGYIFIRSRIGERSRLHFIRSRIGERSRLVTFTCPYSPDRPPVRNAKLSATF